MKYYYLEPEPVSETGDLTSFDRSFFPQKVHKIHWMIDCWNGDVLVELFTCFIITEAAMKEIEFDGLSGTSFDRVEIIGKGFKVSPIKQSFDGRRFVLVVSQRALGLLQGLGISHAKIEDFGAAKCNV